MDACKTATESGFDELIAAQRPVPGDVNVTLSMFDNEYDNVYTNVPIAQVPPLNLFPRNMTAMLDAIGRFVNRDRRRTDGSGRGEHALARCSA